jgi:hypothetical protein
MGRSCTRVRLESGPRFDLAKLIPSGEGKPGFCRTSLWSFSDGTRVRVSAALSEYGGTLRLTSDDWQQTISLVAHTRHFGGCQWYALCPRTGGRKARVLFRPPGASYFASRYAWGRQVAYASQFEDPIGRAHRTQATVKARALGDADPDEWDFPPKPKRMRWATYERLERMYDEAEARMDEYIFRALSRLMGPFNQQISIRDTRGRPAR